MAEEFAVRTEEEFERLMESVDAEMRADNVAIPARSIEAWRRICFRFGLALTLPRPDRLPKQGCYEGDDLSIRIFKWVDDRYGDRLKIGPTSGIALLLRGDAYSIRLPWIYGTAYIICDPDMMGVNQSGVISRSATRINALDLVVGLTKSFAKSLSQTELRQILDTFILGQSAVNEIESLPDVQMVNEIRGDLDASTSHLLARPPQYGLSKWSSLQVVEKLIKVFIAQKGQSFARVHDLADLATSAESSGLRQIPRSLLGSVQCPAGVRYGQPSVDLAGAVEAHNAALRIALDVASQIPR